eukprot:Seg519.2 transcript_id=Seg519.2/GoldUCD/mRNA.D3Y31 product="KH-like domain-containing protein 4" protein_id=Seg519.2/GoldUCD/D3Y31
MAEQIKSKTRTRKSKWDVPGEQTENSERRNSASSNEAAQIARERAAQLAAKLAAEGKLAAGVAPLPVIAPAVVNQPPLPQQPSVSSTLEIPDPEIMKLDSGGYMAEIEINDLPSRVNLTKRMVQDKISQQSGAAISTKGRFMAPNEKASLIAQGERPLYLKVQAPIQAKVQVALHKLKYVMRSGGRPDPLGNPFNGSQGSPMNYVQDKVFVGLEFAPPEYNVREKLEGPNGSFLQHIIGQSGAKVNLRGKGSGYLEPNSGRESFEALHIYVSHSRQDGLQAAKALCENLIQSVHNGYKTWDQTRRQQSPYPPQGYGQPPTMYPKYNVPPPMDYSQGNRPNMLIPPPGHNQPPTGQYPPRNYPPAVQYQNQPPPSFQPPYQAPYPQQDSRMSYPPPVHSAPPQGPPRYPPPSGNYPPASYAPPQQSYQTSHRDHQSRDQESTASPHHERSARSEPRKRRFTEDPALIRKTTETKAVKEDNSHSLDSNTKFRSSGEPSRETSRDIDRLDPLPDRTVDASEQEPKFSIPRESAKKKPPEDVFKPPVAPLAIAAKKAKKLKVNDAETKNALSSLIAYDDSDSDEEG